MFTAGGNNTLRSEVHKIMNFMWNKEKVSQLRKECITVPDNENG